MWTEQREREILEFEKLMADMKSDDPQQEKKVIDAEGRRWIKCEYCGGKDSCHHAGKES